MLSKLNEKELSLYANALLTNKETASIYSITKAVSGKNNWIVPLSDDDFRLCLICNSIFEYKNINDLLILFAHGRGHIAKYKAFI